jgi:hypothetical protein
MFNRQNYLPADETRWQLPRATRHSPLARQRPPYWVMAEPGETWAWCYPDEVMLAPNGD